MIGRMRRRIDDERFAGSPTADRRPGDPLIVLRQLVYGFREGKAVHPVLRGIDGVIAPGEWVALLGQSGSGKSTLLHLIAGLEKPDSGAIEVGGERIDSLSERDRTLFRRRHIGFVYQSFNLLPTLTVLENVALAAELHGDPAARARQRSLALLVDVGLAGLRARHPDRLSGGEQQRVAIARALVNDPSLLLADEPTGNLDSRTGEQILDLLHARLRLCGKTMLIATHSREVAERADRIWRLKDGCLEAA
jgi:putative ABC transport system ATP-binding protein